MCMWQIHFDLIWEGYQNISAALKVPQHTVASLILIWDKFGTTKTLPTAGRPAKVSNRWRHSSKIKNKLKLQAHRILKYDSKFMSIGKTLILSSIFKRHTIKIWLTLNTTTKNIWPEDNIQKVFQNPHKVGYLIDNDYYFCNNVKMQTSTVEVGSLHTLRLESLKIIFQPLQKCLNKL